MLALKVTPKNVIFLFLILFFKILLILYKSRSDLLLFEFITDFITDRDVEDLLAVSTSALVSFGKHEPPYAGPALKNLPPILLSVPMPIDTSSTFISNFSHKLANSLINVILVARKALEAYLINSAALLEVLMYFAPFEIRGEY